MKQQRQWFAEELRWSAGLQSERLIKAFASVPREKFLGPGPWHILGDNQFVRAYTRTSDPSHLSHNVLVAIDPRRRLNNGLPTFLASLIEQLNIAEGETVYHVGCGTGYYTAIMAEVAGKAGRIIAVEVDNALARCARRNLAAYSQVEVITANGFSHDPGQVDAILVNAGVAYPSSKWLEILGAWGRMVLPLTLKDGGGRVLKLERRKWNWQAQFVSEVGVYHCVGGRTRSAEGLLKSAFARGDAERVRSLRLDDHEENRDCWLHGQGFCLSRRSP
jgi:protein-L-isoaspartate(D-aspartate) O-methyltransferase